MATPMIRLWYAVIALVVSCVVIAGVSIQYANYVHRQTLEETSEQQRQSDRRWCALLSTLSEGYEATPPRTPAGVEAARRIAELHSQFGCGRP